MPYASLRSHLRPCHCALVQAYLHLYLYPAAAPLSIIHSICSLYCHHLFPQHHPCFILAQNVSTSETLNSRHPLPQPLGATSPALGCTGSPAPGTQGTGGHAAEGAGLSANNCASEPGSASDQLGGTELFTLRKTIFSSTNRNTC